MIRFALKEGPRPSKKGLKPKPVKRPAAKTVPYATTDLKPGRKGYKTR